MTALTRRPPAADVTSVTATINHGLLCDAVRPVPLTALTLSQRDPHISTSLHSPKPPIIYSYQMIHPLSVVCLIVSQVMNTIQVFGNRNYSGSVQQLAAIGNCNNLVIWSMWRQYDVIWMRWAGTPRPPPLIRDQDLTTRAYLASHHSCICEPCKSIPQWRVTWFGHNVLYLWQTALSSLKKKTNGMSKFNLPSIHDAWTHYYSEFI